MQVLSNSFCFLSASSQSFYFWLTTVVNVRYFFHLFHHFHTPSLPQFSLLAPQILPTLFPQDWLHGLDIGLGLLCSTFFCFWFFFLYFFLLQVNSAPVLFHHKLGPICSSPTDRFPREGISLWQLCNASIHVTTSKQTCLKWQCLTTLWFIVDTICIEHQTSVSSVNTNGHRTMFRYCHF